MLSNELWWSDQVYHIHEILVGTKVEVAKAIEFYAPEAQPIITEAIEKGIEKGTTWDEQLPFITAKGRRIWGSRVTLYIGMVTQWLRGAFQDISTETSGTRCRCECCKESILANMSHEIRTP